MNLGPSIAILDKDFNVLGLFEERPKVVRDMPSFDVKTVAFN